MNLIKMLDKLNGWQRLWIVFCGLTFALLIATNPIYVGLEAADYSYRSEFYTALSPESKNKIVDINVLGAPEDRGEYFYDLINHTHEYIILGLANDPSSHNLLVKMPNGQKIAFKAGGPRGEIEKASKEYWGIVTNYAHKQEKINPYLVSMISDWFVFCGLLYAIGAAVAWIRRGFKNHRTNQK